MTPERSQQYAHIQADHADPHGFEGREQDQNFIVPPIPYRIGLFLFYGSIGLSFSQIVLLENAFLYRAFIAIPSAFGFILAYGARGPSHVDMKQYPMITLMVKIWVIYATYLTIVTMFRSGDIGRTIYSGTVFYYMLLSMFLAYRHIEAGYKHEYLWQTLVAMAVLSTSISFYFARFNSEYFGQSDFSFIVDVRSQIISGSSMLIIAVGLVGVTRFRNLPLSYVLVCGIMLIFIISKTRNIILGVIVLSVYTLLVSDKRLSALIQLTSVATTALAIAYFLPLYMIDFDIIDAWFGRLFLEDESLSVETFYTRVGEYSAQFKMLTQDIQSSLFGFGYLETVILDPGWWDILFPTADPTYYYETRYFGQHSTWINSLFHGGFIMGTIPTITMAWVAGLGFRQALLKKRDRAKLDLYGLFGCGVVVYMMVPASFGMLYFDRISPVSIAPALIYGLYGWEKFKRQRKLEQSGKSDELAISPSNDVLAGQAARQQIRQSRI